MKILKFGGSSVANALMIEKVVSIIKKRNIKNAVLVFSALGGITNSLLEMGEKLSKSDEKYLEILQIIKDRHFEIAYALAENDCLEKLKEVFEELENLLAEIKKDKKFSFAQMDYLASFGERLSCLIITYVFRKFSFKAEFLDTRNLIKTNSNFLSAIVDFQVSNENIQKYFASQKEEKLFITTGFIASSKDGKTTTLGRGGSDYTVSIIGAALSCQEIEIYTDVDGIKTADPRIIKTAYTIPNLTYEEAMEMSYFGAKIIFPPSIQPAMDKKIPILIKNTYNPEFQGTWIKDTIIQNKNIITGITTIDNIALLKLNGSGMIGVCGFSARLFGVLSKNNINIVLISQASSEHSICFAINNNKYDLEKAVKSINSEFDFEIKNRIVEPISYETDLSILAIVGSNMIKRVGISGKIFNSLGKNGINVEAIAQGSSELNISVIISQKDKIKAVKVLHHAFFNDKEINLFLVGTGLIGSTLLSQIKKHNIYLQKNKNFKIKVCGIANIDKMYFDNDISLDNWQNVLEQSTQNTDLNLFVENMIEENLPNSIFVDCTADVFLTKKYQEILASSISIVTPNKKANSSSIKLYKTLKETALKYNAKFMYETNVGAGLPIISTLSDLLNSGDEIVKIEAILSGTLSYIFNSFNSKTLFSHFGKRGIDFHKGIDIAGENKSKIFAVEKGRVVFSGQQKGYGNLIVIEHSNYVMTVYSHNYQNMVNLGQTVKKGQLIALMGQTGRATGVHLHFEYRIKGKAIDPLSVLPKK